MSKHFLLLLLLFFLRFAVLAADDSSASSNSPVIPYLTAAEEAKTFELKPGYHLQLVVGDPVIKEPVLAVFDGNGRMYVAEMRSYMQNIDGTGQFTPTGRISMHWSSKGDGVYDRHTVFADNLILPRMILPLDDSVLVNETGSDTIWRFRDTNGDGVADVKEVFRAGGPRGENLEHQPSGLIWGLDNWLYMAVNNYRLRQRGTNIVSEPTGDNRGQWGLTQDDFGRTFFVNAGYEAGPVCFQTPVIYAARDAEGEFAGDYMSVWPLVGTADYQGGLVRVRPTDKTLNHFTGVCGQEVYRGDRLPADLRGDLLFAEPVGRLIRRSKVTIDEGFTILSNPYESEHSEFIRSTDPNFRPVNLITAPDGTLYIVDMYRGVIQESAWVGPGSYLRGKVQELQLDKNIGRGRIWRLVHDGFQPGPQPHMLDEKPAQLVPHLENPNGWWRLTAQKLLVLRGDKSVVPALLKMARTDAEPLARIHALWTLEGLDSLNAPLLREKFADANPEVRVAAIRVSESLYQTGDHSLTPAVLQLINDSDPNVVLQVMMTALYLKWPDAKTLVASTVASNPALGIKKIGPLLTEGIVPPVFPSQFTAADQALLTHGEQIYRQLCFACHAPDGRGTPLSGGAPGATMAPSLRGGRIANGPREGAINAVLKGLTGPLDGRTFNAQMVPMQASDDEWIASVVSYVRNSFGNSAGMVSPADVARVRTVFTNRMTPWTIPELTATLPKPLADRWRWKVSASHNSRAAALALDDDLKSRYDTGAPQAPGMWFQVQFSKPTAVGGLALDNRGSPQDFPRGWEVRLSDDGVKWSDAVAAGHGTGAQTEIQFLPARTRFIRVILTASAPGRYWSIHDLQVLSPPPAVPSATVVEKPKSSVYE